MTLGRRPFCAIVNDTEVIVDNVTESNVERPTYKVTPFRHGHHVFELCLTHTHTHIYIYIYRVSQEEFARLREGVPYAKLYRYNPKHLSPKWNGYGDNGQRKVWSSCGSTHCTCRLTMLPLSTLSVVSHNALSAGRWAVNFTA